MPERSTTRRGPVTGRARRVLALTTSAAVGVGLAAAPAAAAPPDSGGIEKVRGLLTSYVNPFIGTKDDGNTYPGAATPFGMVQLSPDNGHNLGYNYDNETIRGFSLLHVSGAGCGLGGPLPVLPTTGDPTKTDYADYALKYSHDDEEAAPGYYRVGLQAPDGVIDAELTASQRTGGQRYTFPATKKATVMLNTGQALNTVDSSSVRVVNDRTVETTITTSGFCQETEPQTFHTRTTFDRPFTVHGTWHGEKVTEGSDTATGKGLLGAYVQFDARKDRDVEAVTSMSYVDARGARANLRAERAGFDEMRTAADDAWEERLRTVRIKRGATEDLRTFYSSLYRSFLAPNVGTDVDGRYRGWDQKVHAEPGFTYYQNYSLWDTYRTQEQLLALLAPQESADMALSVVRQGQQNGWLPRWGYGTVETNIMTGDPVTPFLVSAFHQGLLAGHEDEAYEVLKQNADGVPPADAFDNGRAGNVEYIRDGFVPQDPSRKTKPGDFDLDHGGGATLEYALADAMLSTMARELGHDADARRYAERGQSYRNVFDPRTGAFRARGSDGTFVGDPDPAQSEGFHEGTAVQYQWLVPQDVPGLVDLLGGRKAATSDLDGFFAYDQLLEDPEGTARDVWVNGTYDYYGWHTYNPNNEPNLSSPYTYLWLGEPWKTTDVVRAASTLFTDGPDGVTGNDDLGTMSAWHVLSSIGVYPMAPGSDLWGLTTPRFEDVKISLDRAFYGRSSLHVTADGVSQDDRYTRSVQLGGDDVPTAFLDGADLTSGKTLNFEVGDAPSRWATEKADRPGAVAPGRKQDDDRLFAGVAPKQPVVRPGGSVTTSLEVVGQGTGTVTGTVKVVGRGPVQAETDLATWRARSNGLPATVAGDVTLSAPEDAEPGTYAVRVVVREDDGTKIVKKVPVVVTAESWISGAFDNTGIGDAGKANADLDGEGAYLLRDGLADLGAVQGTSLKVPGSKLSYVLGAPEAGEPDNVLANGQELAVPEELSGARKIALVGTSTFGTQTGTLSLGFADGSSTAADVTLTDWCAGEPEGDNVVVAKPGTRGNGEGTDSGRCGLYATAPIDVPAGKTLASVTLPSNDRMHVFAIATN